MANEKRLRLLSLTTGGNQVKLGATLAASSAGTSDTVTFNGPLEYANGAAVSIGSDQYLPIVVDPDTAVAEEIWVTATPNASYQAACLRGMGSSTGAPTHAANAIVVSGPTPADFWHGGRPIDAPWGGSLGYDYEFQGNGTTLPSGWTWTNQGTATYAEAWGSGGLYAPSAGGSTTFYGIGRSMSATAFTVTTHCEVTMGAQCRAYPVVLVGSGGIVAFGAEVNTATPSYGYCIDLFSSAFAYSSSPVTLGIIPDLPSMWQVVVHSNTNIDFKVSKNGANWIPVSTGYNPGASLGTISQVGIGSENFQSPTLLEPYWFRVR